MDKGVHPIALVVLLLISFSTNIIYIYKVPQRKAAAVKEYLRYPENYAIQYVYPKEDTVCIDTIVTYLK